MSRCLTLCAANCVAYRACFSINPPDLVAEGKRCQTCSVCDEQLSCKGPKGLCVRPPTRLQASISATSCLPRPAALVYGHRCCSPPRTGAPLGQQCEDDDQLATAFVDRLQASLDCPSLVSLVPGVCQDRPGVCPRSCGSCRQLPKDTTPATPTRGAGCPSFRVCRCKTSSVPEYRFDARGCASSCRYAHMPCTCTHACSWSVVCCGIAALFYDDITSAT